MSVITGTEVMTGFNIYWQIALWVTVAGIGLFVIMFIITKVKENLRDKHYERKNKK
ncbi:MAG: hypothetical protein K8R58_14045 [Bacteroidales bacterium]|nr:hypothetical protein [Bacteroidales bacterium]